MLGFAAPVTELPTGCILGKHVDEVEWTATNEAHGRAVKQIYVYPLCRDVQSRLTQDSAPRWITWEDA